MRQMSTCLKVEDPRKGNTGAAEEKSKTKKAAPPTYPKPTGIRTRRVAAAPAAAKSQKEESRKIELVEVDDDAVGRDKKRTEKDTKKERDEREEENKKREPEADGGRESGGELDVEATKEVADVRKKSVWSDSSEEEDAKDDEKSRTSSKEVERCVEIRKQCVENVQRNFEKMKQMLAEGKGGDAFYGSIKTLFDHWKEFSTILTELTERVLTEFQVSAEDRDDRSNYQTEKSAMNTLLAAKLWAVVDATDAEIALRVEQFNRAGFKVEGEKVSMGDTEKYVHDYDYEEEGEEKEGEEKEEEEEREEKEMKETLV